MATDIGIAWDGDADRCFFIDGAGEFIPGDFITALLAEAFRVTDDKGQPTIVYLHISKNTFLELGQATPQRPAGFTHYGLHVENAAAAVGMFKQRGVTVTQTNVSAGTKSILANITDPYMGRIELVQITPESLHQKAIQSWK